MKIGARNIFSFKIWVWSNTFQSGGFYNWTLFKNAHNSFKKESPKSLWQESHERTSWWIPAAKNSLGCCLNYCTTPFSISLSDANLTLSVNGPTMTASHGDKYRCLSTSSCMTFCWCRTLWATWELSAAWCHQSVYLLCSGPTECHEMGSAQISNIQPKLVTVCFSHVWTLKETPHDGWCCRQGCNTVL